MYPGYRSVCVLAAITVDIYAIKSESHRRNEREHICSQADSSDQKRVSAHAVDPPIYAPEHHYRAQRPSLRGLSTVSV